MARRDRRFRRQRGEHLLEVDPVRHLRLRSARAAATAAPASPTAAATSGSTAATRAPGALSASGRRLHGGAALSLSLCLLGLADDRSEHGHPADRAHQRDP
jgi:hypothetical protein